MTCLLSVRSSTGLYGAEGVILDLLPELTRQGDAAHLACIQDHVSDNRELLNAATAAGIHARALPCRSKVDRETISALVEYAKQVGAEALQSHDPKSTLFCLLATRRLKLPVVATLHGWVDTTRAMRIYNWVESKLLRFCAAVTLVAPGMAERLKNRGVRSSAIHVIANGVDVDKFRPAAEPVNGPHFCTVARLSSEKGLDLLIEAFAGVQADYPDAKLTIAGAGSLEAELVAQANTLGVSQAVNFLGYVEQPLPVYQAGSCYVCSSHTEGMPLSVLEALACGLPVISTDVGSLSEVLGKTKGGRVIPAGSVVKLAAAMREVCERQPFWTTAGGAGRQGVVEHYSLVAQAKAYSKLFSNVVSAGQTDAKRAAA